MRIGIIGAGFMGATHAEAWAHTPARVAGIVANHLASAQALAAQHGARAYASLDGMLPEVDVVDICTPTPLHCELAVQAAAAGKHVVCEKPLARTEEQGRAMIAVCEAAGVQLLPAHVLRYFPEYAQAKATLDSGKLGPPAVLRLARCTYQPAKSGDNWFVDLERSGGVMLDMMIHDFDYARWVAGDVASVFAKERESHAQAILTHSNGALSHVEGSWAFPQPTFRTRFEIAGASGLIEYDSVFTAPVEVIARAKGADGAPEVPMVVSTLREDPYVTQAKALYATLAEGAPPRVTAHDALQALRISLAAIESAKSGRAIRLD